SCDPVWIAVGNGQRVFGNGSRCRNSSYCVDTGLSKPQRSIWPYTNALGHTFEVRKWILRKRYKCDLNTYRSDVAIAKEGVNNVLKGHCSGESRVRPEVQNKSTGARVR